TMYSSYTAASFARKHDLAARHDVNLEGALTWAFEFEDQPYFAGFRSLASNGIDKPVLNVFRMFSKMGRQRLTVESDAAVPLEIITRRGVRARPDVSALATKDGNKIAVLVWHYHDEDIPGEDAAVDLALNGMTSGVERVRMTHYRIDEKHSNAFSAWKRLGSPQQPTPEQYASLEQAGRLAVLGPAEDARVEQGKLRLRFLLPRQAVDLVVISQ
ncbi:MAG: beta-xylosidase, partial [Chloroflexi bacterium]